MLAQFVLTTRAASVCRAQHLLRRAILDCQNGRTCQPRTRCWRSICQGANALPYCACPHRYTRLIGRCNLEEMHAPLYPNDETAESVSSARAIAGRPVRRHMLSHILPAAQLFPTLSHYINKIVMGYGALPHVHPRPLTFALDLNTLVSLLFAALQQAGLAQEVAHFLCDGGKLGRGDGRPGDKDNLSAFGNLGQIQPQALF